MAVLADLVRDLKALRKGRGVCASQIGGRVGGALRDVCAVNDDDGPAQIRRKVTERLADLAADLPADLRVAVLAAFAICPEVQLPLYQDRVNWAAERLDRDPRTVRRRIDDGISHLAQLATAGAGPRPGTDAPDEVTGWHTSKLAMMVALDREQPEALEQRRIVSDQDGLTELDLAVTLAVPSRRALGVDLFYGGTLIDRGMESSERHAFALSLPRPLAKGESHDFAVHFRLPDAAALRPYFVCVPRRPCELFELRVRFDRSRIPPAIWILRGTFQRDVSDPVPPGEPQPTDPAGEIHVLFRDLTPGLAYGARWDSALEKLPTNGGAPYTEEYGDGV